jgi:TonB family protein
LGNLRQELERFRGTEYSADAGLRLLDAIRTVTAGMQPQPQPFFAIRRLSAPERVTLEVNFSPQFGVVQTPFGVVGGPASQSVPRAEIADIGQLNPLTTVLPDYPPLARQARVQGQVVADVSVNQQGSVENIKIVTGHPLLIQAVINAVRQWTYPAQAAGVVTRITVNFAF